MPKFTLECSPWDGIILKAFLAKWTKLKHVCVYVLIIQSCYFVLANLPAGDVGKPELLSCVETWSSLAPLFFSSALIIIIHISAEKSLKEK